MRLEDRLLKWTVYDDKVSFVYPFKDSIQALQLNLFTDRDVQHIKFGGKPLRMNLVTGAKNIEEIFPDFKISNKNKRLMLIKLLEQKMDMDIK
jgi:hypothetical protein